MTIFEAVKIVVELAANNAKETEEYIAIDAVREYFYSLANKEKGR